MRFPIAYDFSKSKDAELLNLKAENGTQFDARAETMLERDDLEYGWYNSEKACFN